MTTRKASRSIPNVFAVAWRDSVRACAQSCVGQKQKRDGANFSQVKLRQKLKPVHDNFSSLSKPRHPVLALPENKKSHAD